MFNILISQQPEQKTPARLRAENLMLSVEQQLQERVNSHQRSYDEFWNPADGTTTEEILLELGTKATKFLQVASESVEHILRLAAIAGVQFDYSIWLPKKPFIFHPDGSVTLDQGE